MQVISAARLLNAGRQAAGQHPRPGALTPRAVYSKPTPRQLAQYIFQTSTTPGGNVGGDHDGRRDQQEAMAALLGEYTRDLHRGVPGRPDAASEGQTVVLTGSTGALGSYLLDALARNPRVRTIVVHQGYTRTALFTGYRNDAPFLVPALEPASVADAVARQIFTGRSGQVVTPLFGCTLPLLRALPHWYAHRFRAKGANIMTNFAGRQVVTDLDKHYAGREKDAKAA